MLAVHSPAVFLPDGLPEYRRGTSIACLYISLPCHIRCLASLLTRSKEQRKENTMLPRKKKRHQKTDSLENHSCFAPKWSTAGHTPSARQRNDQERTVKKLFTVSPDSVSSKQNQHGIMLSLLHPSARRLLHVKDVSIRDQIFPIPMTGVPSPCSCSGIVCSASKELLLTIGCRRQAGWVC